MCLSGDRWEDGCVSQEIGGRMGVSLRRWVGGWVCLSGDRWEDGCVSQEIDGRMGVSLRR